MSDWGRPRSQHLLECARAEIAENEALDRRSSDDDFQLEQLHVLVEHLEHGLLSPLVTGALLEYRMRETT